MKDEFFKLDVFGDPVLGGRRIVALKGDDDLAFRFEIFGVNNDSFLTGRDN